MGAKKPCSASWSVAGSSANPAAASDFLSGVLPSGTVFFAAGEESRLRSAFEWAGFPVVELATEALAFAFPSFDAYFGGVERGEGHMGQEYTALPDEVRRAVREETRRDIEGDLVVGDEVQVERVAVVVVASGDAVN